MDAPGVEGAFDRNKTFYVPGRVAPRLTPPWVLRPAVRRHVLVRVARTLVADRYRLSGEYVKRAFAGAGWRVPQLLSALDPACEIFFGPLTRAEAPNWSKGRVVLLGDAAWGATLGGMGPRRIVGAYVLAGELSSSPEDHAAASRATSSASKPMYGSVRKAATGPAASSRRARVTDGISQPADELGSCKQPDDPEGRKITSNIALPPYRSLELLRIWWSPGYPRRRHIAPHERGNSESSSVGAKSCHW